MDYAKVQRVQVGSARIIAVSDIHGSPMLFDKLLEKCEFKPGEDVLVIIGDMLEKGDDSIGVLRRIMELSRKGRVYPLLGNCDSYFDSSLEDIWEHFCRWKERTIQWQMAELAGIQLPSCKEEIMDFHHRLEEKYPGEHRFLNELPHILETERFLFAHGGLTNEDLEHQQLSFVLATPFFPKEITHVFSKLLLVGHYPASIFRGHLDNSPYYHKAHNVLSIDGGNTIKSISQLNGIILDSKTGAWEAVTVDGSKEIAAPCSQEYVPGKDIVWPNNKVTVVHDGTKFVKVMVETGGDIFEAPKDFLYSQNGELHCMDMPTKRLQVHKGETIRLVKIFENRMLIRKGNDSGWLFLD